MSKERPCAVKITSKRQVTFPKHVLDAMNVGPGDVLAIRESPAGYVVEPQRASLRSLPSLHHLVSDDTPEFDINAFRESSYDSKLGD